MSGNQPTRQQPDRVARNQPNPNNQGAAMLRALNANQPTVQQPQQRLPRIRLVYNPTQEDLLREEIAGLQQERDRLRQERNHATSLAEEALRLAQQQAAELEQPRNQELDLFPTPPHDNQGGALCVLEPKFSLYQQLLTKINSFRQQDDKQFKAQHLVPPKGSK